MKFEWDAAKSRANFDKHGLDLEGACVLWNGPVYVLDSRHPDEPRKLALGTIDGKHWTVIFTMRGATVRLISARRSERKIYDENHSQES